MDTLSFVHLSFCRSLKITSAAHHLYIIIDSVPLTVEASERHTSCLVPSGIIGERKHSEGMKSEWKVEKKSFDQCYHVNHPKGAMKA